MTGNRNSGAVLIWMTLCILALIGFAALAIDIGRLRLVKSELQVAADAAARAAGNGLWDGTAEHRAKSVAKANSAGGEKVKLKDEDMEWGHWDFEKRVFTPDGEPRNALRVVARRTREHGDPLPMIFAAALGIATSDVQAEAIVAGKPPLDALEIIPAQANPWLAGMPEGTLASPNNPHDSPDFAPQQSPVLVSTLPFQPGDILTFDSITGTGRHDPNLPFFEPDGELVDIWWNITPDTGIVGSSYSGEHGKSNVKSPINAIIGVFLDDTHPSRNTRLPRSLDFSSAASRDFTTLSPKLNQTFFIGDGLDSSGEHQQFVVPEGATRFYMGMMDFFEWNNNFGDRTMKVTRQGSVQLVK